MPENLVTRDGFSCPVPRQPAHLHTRAEFGAYVRDSFRVPRRRPFILYKGWNWIGRRGGGSLESVSKMAGGGGDIKMYPIRGKSH